MGLEQIARLSNAGPPANKGAQVPPGLLEGSRSDRSTAEILLAEQVLDRLGTTDATQPVETALSECANGNSELQVERQHPLMHSGHVKRTTQAQ